MTDPTPVSELTHSKVTQCPRCESAYEQLNINGNWWPVEHPACPKAPADPRALKRFADPDTVRSDHERLRAETDAARMNSLHVPSLYQDATFETFRCATQGHKIVLARAKAFAEKFRLDDPTFPQVVLMLGPPGTGKGHLAWSIAKHVATTAKVGAVKFAKCSDIILDLRQSWNGAGGDSEISRLKAYRSLDLLVIDEVSRDALYGEPSKHLYDLIDYRQEWLRPTIVTSNEDLKGITELLSDALVSRASGGAQWEFSFEDYRPKKRRERAAS